MLKIIRGKMMRLSKLSSQEMIVEAIEKASKQILNQTALIKTLTLRVEELEEEVKERGNEIDDIFRALDAT
jgi:methanogenic corrinoid protein MtbC1